MHRFISNYGAEMANGNNDSVFSCQYDWNELSVGNDTLQSDNFFGVKHPEHERDRENQAIIKFETTADEAISDDIENNQNNGNVIKTEMNSIESDTLSSDLDEMQIEPLESKKAVKSSNGQVNAGCLNKFQLVPNVYHKVELMRKKHEAQAVLREKEEREKRKFHAKKAPNFHAIHAVQHEKEHRREEEKMEKVTIPTTPKVVHRHRQNMERIKEKMQELEAAKRPKPFVSQEPDVLFKQPFVPQKKTKAPTAPKPFRLQSEDRLQKRHEFDEQIRMEMERKKKEQEEERKIEDEMIRRDIRKGTTFKANPNPFSQY